MRRLRGISKCFQYKGGFPPLAYPPVLLEHLCSPFSVLSSSPMQLVGGSPIPATLQEMLPPCHDGLTYYLTPQGLFAHFMNISKG